MSGAIEALLSEENWKRGDPLSLAVGQSQAIVRDVVLTKARAELAAKDATIERLREALENITKWEPKDYEKGAEYWTWGNYDDVYQYGADGAYSAAAKYAKDALSSLPPSDMRLVPVERLREIHEIMQAVVFSHPDSVKAARESADKMCHWLADAIRDAEGEKP